MAASRVASSRRLCSKYKYIFYVAIIILSLQMFLAFSFYKTKQHDFKEWEIWRNDREQSSNRKYSDKSAKLQKTELSNKSRHKKTEVPLIQENNNIENSNDVALSHLIEENGKGPPIDQEDIEKNRNVKYLSNISKQNSNQSSVFYPKCELKSKEALSAINRATTVDCKQQIADTACKAAEWKLYPKHLPRFCHLSTGDSGKYLGCYRDVNNDRDLDAHHRDFPETNSKKVCLSHCLQGGYKYSALQFTKECWCGDSYGKHGSISEKACDTPCPGNPKENCGGFLSQRIFATGIGEKLKNEAPLKNNGASGKKPVKIVFVLTLNGRQVRQVFRLLRAIYHKDHFYYIHVDKRQEYMFRELLPLERKFQNVYIAKQRFSTIWGGASLLDAHLNFISELLDMRKWTWDYYLNLSESDYPIKKIENLVEYLTTYKGMNFLKSYGKDTPRFILKQGLDQTFYECDNHLWRLGRRNLSSGILLDGGSDWIGLYREYASYAVRGTDKLLTGLKQIYKYSLLPVESFFHTLLHNSRFCDKLVDNNLHITNWKRKLGCKCQYKHIVDWCGCSPNDFKPSDLDKLMQFEEKPVFFARKFEPIVNQEIINNLDIYLFGSYTQELHAINSYWQNEYHHLDKSTKVNDAYLTIYHSFIRYTMGHLFDLSSQCKLRPLELLEVNVFYESDHFHGVLVQFQVEQVSTGNVITLESHMHSKQIFEVFDSSDYIGRLQSLQVGSDFDPKELIFRNYAAIVGPFSDVVLRHVWGPGPELTVSVAWIDPTNTIAASFDIVIPNGVHIGSHKPTFKKPLRPGVWRIRLLYQWKVVAEAEFLISPLSFYNGKPMSAKEIHLAHSGPSGLYAGKDFSDFREVLHIKPNKLLEKQSVINGKKVGRDLENWIDSLAVSFWSVKNVCALEANIPQCPTVTECRTSAWSSSSPDPKSDMNKFDIRPNMFR